MKLVLKYNIFKSLLFLTSNYKKFEIFDPNNKCSVCQVSFHTQNELKQHLDLPECKAFLCPHCGTDFQTADAKKKQTRFSQGSV